MKWRGLSLTLFVIVAAAPVEARGCEAIRNFFARVFCRERGSATVPAPRAPRVEPGEEVSASRYAPVRRSTSRKPPPAPPAEPQSGEEQRREAHKPVAPESKSASEGWVPAPRPAAREAAGPAVEKIRWVPAPAIGGGNRVAEKS